MEGMFGLMILLSLPVKCFTAPPSHRAKFEGNYKSCSWRGSCAEDECCADIQPAEFFGGGRFQVCKKRRSVGSICDPKTMPGGSTCPCKRGLTCILAQILSNGKEIHRCVPLIEFIDEIEEII